jgi:hypothetical protein
MEEKKEALNSKLERVADREDSTTKRIFCCCQIVSNNEGGLRLSVFLP